MARKSAKCRPSVEPFIQSVRVGEIFFDVFARSEHFERADSSVGKRHGFVRVSVFPELHTGLYAVIQLGDRHEPTRIRVVADLLYEPFLGAHWTIS